MIINITSNNGTGTNQAFIIKDATGLILDIQTTNPVDLSACPDGAYSICEIFYEAGLTGLVVGQNISGLSGCFSLSNNTIDGTKITLTASVISTADPTTVCIGTGAAVNINVMVDTVGGGDDSDFVLISSVGEILSINDTGIFDVDGYPAGTCTIQQIWYQTGITGLTQGQNISGLVGCFVWSNAITLTKEVCTDCYYIDRWVCDPSPRPFTGTTAIITHTGGIITTPLLSGFDLIGGLNAAAAGWSCTDRIITYQGSLDLISITFGWSGYAQETYAAISYDCNDLPVINCYEVESLDCSAAPDFQIVSITVDGVVIPDTGGQTWTGGFDIDFNVLNPLGGWWLCNGSTSTVDSFNVITELQILYIGDASPTIYNVVPCGGCTAVASITETPFACIYTPSIHHPDTGVENEARVDTIDLNHRVELAFEYRITDCNNNIYLSEQRTELWTGFSVSYINFQGSSNMSAGDTINSIRLYYSGTNTAIDVNLSGIPVPASFPTNPADIIQWQDDIRDEIISQVTISVGSIVVDFTPNITLLPNGLFLLRFVVSHNNSDWVGINKNDTQINISSGAATTTVTQSTQGTAWNEFANSPCGQVSYVVNNRLTDVSPPEPIDEVNSNYDNIVLLSNNVVISPTAPITQTCTEDVLTAVLTPACAGAATYVWSLDGTVLVGETNETLTATTAGTYDVEITCLGCVYNAQFIKT